MKIFLTGLMGSGKSHYGEILAKTLEIPFVDLDKVIEKREQSSIASIFEKKGESGFREIETKVLQSFDYPENCIIACGGGTIITPENLSFIKNHGKIIFLFPPFRVVAERLKKEKEDRPLLKNIPEENFEQKLKELLEKRLPFYRQADLVIDPTGISPEDLPKWLKNL